MNPPNHVAIIMDGNRRWAKSNGLQSFKGHAKGKQALQYAIEYCIQNSISYLTCYAFSSENWKRTKEELDYLKDLLLNYLIEAKDKFISNEISLEVIGNYQEFGKEIATKIDDLKESSKNCKKLKLVIALNYGSRQEILNALNNIIKDVKNSDTIIDEQIFNSYLYTANIPEPDLIIRTGGEKRLSNFLLWQSIYSELIFLDVLWPDFKTEDFHKAILEYHTRERRNGK